MLKGEYEVFQPEDNCRFVKYTLRMLFDYHEQIQGSDVIHWNNGLWDISTRLFDDGLPFTSEEEYVENMLRVATQLKKLGKRVIFATTTPVHNEHPYNDNAVIKRYNEFSIINNISFLDNYICIADIYKSVALFTYDIEQEKLIEITRDYNPSWILSTVQYDINTMYLSDIDGNVISIQNESLSDESGNKFERKGIFNLGERISKFSITKLQGKSLKDIAVMDNDTEEVSVVYYGTIEGSLGVIIQIKKEVFEILEMIQNKLERNECVKKKGFVEGNVLEKFLNFDEEYRKEFLKEINYQCKHNISEIINIIETLLKYH
jgi:hypothetical protein